MMIPVTAVAQSMPPASAEPNAVFAASKMRDWPLGVQAGPAMNPLGGLLDSVLLFLRQTAIPFLAMLAVQGITVFFVLRFMMRLSAAGSEVTPLNQGAAAIPVAR